MNTRIQALVVVAMALLLLVSCSSDGSEDTSPPSTTSTTTGVPSTDIADDRIPVIVDYSPTVSDVGGLMYLLLHPDVSVVAISLPVTGEAGCDLGLEVTLGLLAELGRDDIPVACDEDRPPDAGVWPQEFLIGHERLADGLPENRTGPSEMSGPELIVSAVESSTRPVVFWAVAPLTNVARALDRQPEIVDRIDRIVIMGGAVDTAGNTFSSDAEWNFAIDPEAAEAVVSSGVPITLVPLDATNDVPVPVGYGETLAGAEQAAAISRLSSYVDDFPAVTSGFYYFWDELAATVITNPEVVATETATIAVSTSGPDGGRTIRDNEGYTVTLATAVPAPDDFYGLFLSTLAGAPVSVETGASSAARAYFTGLNEAMADSVAAIEAGFDSGALFGDVYDPAAVEAALAPFFTAQEAAVPLVEALQPPENLAELHQSYVSALAAMADIREELPEIVNSVDDFDALGEAFEARWPGLFSACSSLAQEAERLGIATSLPC